MHWYLISYSGTSYGPYAGPWSFATETMCDLLSWPGRRKPHITTDPNRQPPDTKLPTWSEGGGEAV